MTVNNIIEQFNDGNWDEISSIFNGRILTFFRFIKGKNLLHKIDINNIPSDDFSNEVFDYLV